MSGICRTACQDNNRVKSMSTFERYLTVWVFLDRCHHDERRRDRIGISLGDVEPCPSPVIYAA